MRRRRPRWNPEHIRLATRRLMLEAARRAADLGHDMEFQEPSSEMVHPLVSWAPVPPGFGAFGVCRKCRMTVRVEIAPNQEISGPAVTESCDPRDTRPEIVRLIVDIYKKSYWPRTPREILDFNAGQLQSQRDGDAGYEVSMAGLRRCLEQLISGERSPTWCRGYAKWCGDNWHPRQPGRRMKHPGDFLD